MASKQDTRPFDPEENGLDKDFRLTKFTELGGWGCKVPQDVLNNLLEGLCDMDKAKPGDSKEIGNIIFLNT